MVEDYTGVFDSSKERQLNLTIIKRYMSHS